MFEALPRPSRSAKSGGIAGTGIRFEIVGGDYRLIAAFDFDHQIAFVKFIGTHAEYDVVSNDAGPRLAMF